MGFVFSFPYRHSVHLVKIPNSYFAGIFAAHTSLDEHVAYWFGLNQSKYQWALDDYYESKGTSPTDMKANGVSGKVQNRVQNV